MTEAIVVKTCYVDPKTSDKLVLMGTDSGSLVLAVEDGEDGEVGTIVLRREDVVKLASIIGMVLYASEPS